MNLNDLNKSENDFQKELEKDMIHFYPFWLLNHGVHLGIILSKWHITDEYETDITYITKSSDEWWIVLVEFEPPSIKLLTNGGQATSKLSKGIAQINDWKAYAQRHPGRVRERLERLLAPQSVHLSLNPVRFKYLLIAGRSSELGDDPIKRNKISSLGDQDFKIKTWDSMVYNASNYRESRPNVARFVKGKYLIEKINSSPQLDSISPMYFEFTDEPIEQIKQCGHDYDAWVSNKEIIYACGKYVSLTDTFPNMKSSLS
jgi:hypothetical protein